jgi:hypothetical protein
MKTKQVTWKWNRGGSPGTYVCGDWKIEGAGTSWWLRTPGGDAYKRSSKKDCQLKAEDLANGNGEPNAPKSTIAPPDSLESQLASYRLEVVGLTVQIAELTATINRLNKNLETVKR